MTKDDARARLIELLTEVDVIYEAWPSLRPDHLAALILAALKYEEKNKLDLQTMRPHRERS